MRYFFTCYKVFLRRICFPLFQKSSFEQYLTVAVSAIRNNLNKILKSVLPSFFLHNPPKKVLVQKIVYALILGKNNIQEKKTVLYLIWKYVVSKDLRCKVKEKKKDTDIWWHVVGSMFAIRFANKILKDCISQSSLLHVDDSPDMLRKCKFSWKMCLNHQNWNKH